LPLALAASLSSLLSGCGPGSDDPAAQQARTARMAAQVTSAASETALTPVSAAASGQERGDLSAAMAIDHDGGTRWGSAFADDQWLTLDYGAPVSIDRVHIAWENAHASSYLLQVSDDNTHWTTVRSVDNSAGGIEDIGGLSAQGRYLRMQGVKRATPYGYSIFEIQA
jgi:hypothetical protein